MAGKGDFVCFDGNRAAVHVAYAMSEIAFIYPITPSSPMAEMADVYCTEGRKNVFGSTVSVVQMQSEGGAAGAIHGGAAAGALVTNFTASQGLLLMIPDIFKCAGELLPVVWHVAARQVAQSSSSIFGEHSDVMAVRQTGVCILSSHTVQECMDYAAVAHVAALKASLPVMHFFDGFHLSHELTKIRAIPYEDLKKLVPEEAIRAHRARASHPGHPTIGGALQGRDTYFQGIEAGHRFFRDAPAVFEEAMKEVEAITGRHLSLFEYVGPEDAERVICLMGAGSGACIEAADYLNKNFNAKVGVCKVHLFRPWSAKHFLASLPKTVKSIAVLDRTKEPGSCGEPLYLDISTSILHSDFAGHVKVVGGRFGLGDKAFTPAMVAAIYDNLAQAEPKNGFTVGITDDVCNTSLVVGKPINTVPEGTKQCIFWGFGSDGTVGANRLAVELIAMNTDLYSQGYFFFTAHKAGGVTTSHLRFGPKQITSTYPISEADYVAVHHPAYIAKYPLADNLKQGGTFVVNCTWNDLKTLESQFPASLKRELAARHAKIHVIDAYKISREAGLGGHINGVMQSVFFALSGVMPVDKAISLYKESVKKAYAKKGQKIVDMNINAIDHALTGLTAIEYSADEWAKATDAPVKIPDTYTQWVRELKMPIDAMQGDKLPTSKFIPGGASPTDTTWQEKRCIAVQVPEWDADACVQCNTCAAVCPHGAIRPYLFEEEEVKAVPPEMKLAPAKGLQGDLKDKKLMFRIQVSALDCTGCGVCMSACPAASKGALKMISINEAKEKKEPEHWEICEALPRRTRWFDNPANIKSAMFRQPLYQFSAACSGCGEAGYIKMLTQLFGERLVVSNAAGCSSAISVTYGSCPYAHAPSGWGPALRVSLFEENAEFALGMLRAQGSLRQRLASHVTDALADKELSEKFGAELCALLQKWLDEFADPELTLRNAQKIIPMIEKLHKELDANVLLQKIFDLRDAFVKVTYWTMGGDGWAYDIDYGGLDHVLSMGSETRVIVLDTEVYSNTGGQVSKATPEGGIHKFAAGGKDRAKKDLGAIAMAYGHIYVASVCLDANPAQAMKAFQEADRYPGPALVLCYCPCIEHGIDGGSKNFVDHAKLAVKSGYWPLYRFNPLNAQAGKPLLEIDGPAVASTTNEAIEENIHEFLSHENRFARLAREKPERAAVLHKALCTRVETRWETLKRRAQEAPIVIGK